jgi:hypothetical protein
LFPKQIAGAEENNTRVNKTKGKNQDSVYQVHPSVIPLDVFDWARNGRFVHGVSKTGNPAETI